MNINIEFEQEFVDRINKIAEVDGSTFEDIVKFAFYFGILALEEYHGIADDGLVDKESND